jgi:hypothetical protein
VNIYKQSLGLCHQVGKSLVSAKKFGSPQWPISLNDFRIRITREFEMELEKISYKTEALMGLIDDKARGRKSHATVPVKNNT